MIGNKTRREDYFVQVYFKNSEQITTDMICFKKNNNEILNIKDHIAHKY